MSEAALEMRSMIELEETDDRELAAMILTNPEIWERIAEDGIDREKFEAEQIPEDWRLVAVKTPHGTAGLYMLHETDPGRWQIHANILEAFRGRYAAESGAAILEWMDEHLPESARLAFAVVPVIYPDVMAFTLRYGFKDVGALGVRFRKNGKSAEQRVLMILREDWV